MLIMKENEASEADTNNSTGQIVLASSQVKKGQGIVSLWLSELKL